MNLPFILDVAIGLVFIYLIISLLASEIQELLTTILQWRAAHLKKSIEILLAGGDDLDNQARDTENRRKAREIVDDIYNNPLVKNISQGSFEGIEATLRKIARMIVTLFGLRKNRTLVGNEPSYIPAETFASTLLERLNIPQLNQKLVALNLQKLVDIEISTKVRSYLDDPNLQLNDAIRETLTAGFTTLEARLIEICQAYRDETITLFAAVNQIEDELDLTVNTSFINQVQLLTQDESVVQQLVDQLAAIRKTLFKDGTDDHINEFMARLQPSLVQTLDLLVDDVVDEAKAKHQTYLTLRQEIEAAEPADRLYGAYDSVKQEINKVSNKLSPSVRQSLAALARRAQLNLQRAQAKVEVVETELSQFQVEVQTWFDRSMERASGVYKRNAKGVAFLIGFLLALVINADTFHIVDRLSTDAALRDALANNADFVVAACPSQSTGGDNNAALECLRTGVSQSLPLPIGWSEDNRSQQFPENGSSVLKFLKGLPGWIVSGLAISMGASFWFDLLGKIINVRNAGKRPESPR
ncbi:hypothetical protein H6G89_11815 [Oscillatoria sp. FACHB-1407]|uniref:hypothetical protein n=1 Tax=Oscillatoria sp. FACHB-1407 TaxID=2692847 RepID=UPI0016868411|nr:hypothetical protein [Oscillatoria sp. FACHB-1407]MBD2461739.1 hypothetical protein [Oscillatoria sp. FACHB-1407]